MSSAQSLNDRVILFGQLRLPGQPQAMHMGTSNLVNDLWREVAKRDAVIEAARLVTCCDSGHPLLTDALTKMDANTKPESD